MWDLWVRGASAITYLPVSGSSAASASASASALGSENDKCSPGDGGGLEL